ncbi:MAG: hypothetical protein SRB1_02010 [Desulfobacteraceae bacterium Eth-SRB1]|nr:MAG: hypothetical protein SRB1_02010 [Desulfobacteraceae bacterium Eth-SRB1]
MKILFTGDLFTGGQLLEKSNSEIRIDIDSFINADQRICNLEQATSDNPIILDKSTVYSPEKGISFLINNKVDIVSMANNHMQDKGKPGFKDAMRLLTENNIKCAGAGSNIQQAEKALQLTDDLYLMAYCDNNKPYLRKIQIATAEEYGINPFSYEKVIEDLERIPDGKQAILYLHWGKENVWFPPKGNIKIAKQLLEHPKVHSIIGAHSHRMQGRIKHSGKYAFFSLGNFLFPDFYMVPRSKMVYPDPIPSGVKTTKEYHPVFSLTKKIWKYSCRVSMIVILKEGQFKEYFVKQKKRQPVVVELKGFEKLIMKSWYRLLSLFYKLPSSLYTSVEKSANIFDKLIKFMNISFFYVIKERKVPSVAGLLKDGALKKF